MTGSDAVFDAIFRRYGVQRVDDMAQLAAALMLFAQPHALSPGGLATMHDSGGERQLAIDLADHLGVDYPSLDASTVSHLEAILDEGLPAVNPLDAWGGGGVDAPRNIPWQSPRSSGGGTCRCFFALRLGLRSRCYCGVSCHVVPSGSFN